MSPRFSAIIPTYNRWQLAREAVKSVLAQTYPCHQIIVVDDGSTDGTKEKLNAEFGDRILLITKNNGGVSTARNAGVSAATGDYVAYLDSDDLWEPDKIAKVAEVLEVTGEASSFIFSDFRRFETRQSIYYSQTNTQLFPRIFHRFLLSSGATFTADGLAALQCVMEDYPFFPSTFVLHRSLHDDYRWDPAVRYSEDFNFVAKIADRYPMIYIDRPLVTVRMHGSNKSGNWRAKLDSHMRTLKTMELRVMDDKEKARSVRRALGRKHIAAARQLLKARQPKMAAFHAIQTLRYPTYFSDAFADLLKRSSSNTPPRGGGSPREA